MKAFVAIAFALAVIATPSVSFAYSTRSDNGGGCTADGSACNVYCNSGVRAGVMYWNGARWSDGLRSDPDKDVVARQIVAANGSSCT